MARTALKVRRLGSGDLEGVRRLNALFAEAFEDPDAYGGAPPDDAWLTETLAKPHVITLVAEYDGEMVGGLVAYELDKLEQQRREIYIYDLAVTELYRRQGVASALIERTQAIAGERGAWVVYVQADYADPPAVALYTKLGVREDVMHFDIPVEPK